MARSLHVHMEPFDGAKSVRPARRGAPRDAVHRASAATLLEDRFGPPEGRVFAPSGPRYGPLVDGRFTAGSVPFQKMQKTGQSDSI